MEDVELEQAILSLVAQSDYRPVKARVIAEQLHVPKGRVAEVKHAVKDLVRRGQLAYEGNRLVTAADPDRPQGSRLVGIFHRTQRGFGFVRRQGVGQGDAAAPAGARRGSPDPDAADIYIPAKHAGDASTGDLVLVRLGRHHHSDLGPRGAIVEVIERQTQRFVGTYFESRGSGYVQVDGTLFAQPICVGDPGAKNARADDKVVFEMVRFPSPVHEGEGVLTEVLGPQGKPGVDTLSIIRQFNLPEEFPDDVIEQSHRQAEKFDETISPHRVDFTGETVLTIDPADARDFDDAISLLRLENGSWQLGVHIADVAHFVPANSALDREARDRATSVYLPDRVIPMLPEVISNSLASLQPGKVRYAKSVIMQFTAEGLRTATELFSSAIKSSKRLTYEQVDAFLADPQAWRRKLGAKVHELLGLMHQLAMILRRRRLEHGALELTMREVKVELDRAGRVSGARVVANTESHQIIEEFMLAANEAVAEHLRDKEVPFLRRIHPSPNPQKLQALTEFIRELGLKVDSLQSRFELQRLLGAVAGQPEEHAVNFSVLRSLQRALYSPQDEGHYALASDCYCHFTSPIRRYPDLTVHRLIDSLLDGSTPRSHYDELVVLGRHCSDREQQAEAAERDLTKLKLLSYLSGRIGEEMDALVTGVENFGLFVQGVELPAEGLIHADSLADDYYRFDRATHTLTGYRTGNRYRLGDLLRVVVARVDLERRELDFRLVERKRTKAARVVEITKKSREKSPKKKTTDRRTPRDRKRR